MSVTKVSVQCSRKSSIDKVHMIPHDYIKLRGRSHQNAGFVSLLWLVETTGTFFFLLMKQVVCSDIHLTQKNCHWVDEKCNTWLYFNKSDFVSADLCLSMCYRARKDDVCACVCVFSFG